MTQLRTALRALGAALVAGGLLMAAPLAASASTSNLPPCHTCTTVTKTGTSGLLLTADGEAQTPTNPASNAVVSVGNGVEVTLTDATSKVGYTVGIDAPVLLSAIAKIDYATWQLNPSMTALPSVNLTMDLDDATAGIQFATLVYEPVEDGRGNPLNGWHTWDALRNGSAKWWSTRSLPLIAGGDLGPAARHVGPFTWTDILTKYPHARVLAYGLNFGKGATGAHARWKSITFGTIDWCTTTTWPVPTPSPSASASASASASPTGTPTVTPTTQPPASATAPADPTTPPVEPPVDPTTPAGGVITTPTQTSLPLTGSSLRPMAFLGGGAIGVGALLLVGLFVWDRISRRRAT
jgi:hypothetical protein